MNTRGFMALVIWLSLSLTSIANDDSVLTEEDMQQWIEFSTKSNGDVFFFDNTRVEKNDHKISVWTRVRYKTSVMAASSYQSLLRLDCVENSETVLQSTFFTDRNWTKPAMATNTSPKPKTYVKENSSTAQLINTLCED